MGSRTLVGHAASVTASTRHGLGEEPFHRNLSEAKDGVCCPPKHRPACDHWRSVARCALFDNMRFAQCWGFGSGWPRPGDDGVAKCKQAWIHDFFAEPAPERIGLMELSGDVFGASPRLDILHRVVWHA